MSLKISIVIPVYNEEKMISLCLDSLIGLDYPKELLEIIFVDNNSTDLSASIIKKYPVKYIFEKRKGRSAARNTGIKIASGDIIAFTDADCVVDKDWIENLIKGFKTENTGCCSGKTVSYLASNLIEEYFEWLFDHQPKWNINYFEDYLVGTIFATCNLAVRKKIFEEIGLFDEVLLASEDVDVVWRINLKGYQINCVSDAVVYHKRRGTLKEIPEIFFQYMYWQYYLTRKYKKIIGISIDWYKIHLKIFRGIALAFTGLLRINFKEAFYNFFVVLFSLMQFFSAIYIRMEIWFGKERRFSPLTFVPVKVIWRWNIDGSVMILNLETQSGYNISGVGAKIWELLFTGKSASEIIGILSTEYDVDKKELEKDVHSLMEEFGKEQLVAG